MLLVCCLLLALSRLNTEVHKSSHSIWSHTQGAGVEHVLLFHTTCSFDTLGCHTWAPPTATIKKSVYALVHLCDATLRQWCHLWNGARTDSSLFWKWIYVCAISTARGQRRLLRNNEFRYPCTTLLTTHNRGLTSPPAICKQSPFSRVVSAAYVSSTDWYSKTITVQWHLCTSSFFYLNSTPLNVFLQHLKKKARLMWCPET